MTEKKASLSDAEWNNNNLRQKQVGYCLSNYRNAFAKRSVAKTKPENNGYDSTKDIMSPDYKQPKKKTTFTEVLWICYEIQKTPRTFANYERTKKDFIEIYPDRASQVTDYENSELFRQTFSESGQGESNADSIADGNGRIEAKNQVSLSP